MSMIPPRPTPPSPTARYLEKREQLAKDFLVAILSNSDRGTDLEPTHLTKYVFNLSETFIARSNEE